ncbi:MAG: SIS domain-containing protein [Roseiflexaceae bacterium]|nr:SIS domain-containing protein [Roseiflexaceae bacterium]
MTIFSEDIRSQPQALQALADAYQGGAAAALLAQITPGVAPLLTGMGASFHAAAIATLALHQRGVPARAVEASELVFYSRVLLEAVGDLVFVSQSGASAEVLPTVELRGPGVRLIGVTNEPASPLGQHAQLVLPTFADKEQLVATRTYMNAIALLWLLVRRYSGQTDGTEHAVLSALAHELDQQIAQAEANTAIWFDVLAPAAHLLCVGHGPHAITARHAAMMLGEWTKIPTFSATIGAFRHGFIESIDDRSGVVIFSAPGVGAGSAQALAEQLSGYGARVLVVERGHTRRPAAPPHAHAGDEMLATLYDSIPAQLFAEALARERGIPAGFRYIQKVVTTL